MNKRQYALRIMPAVGRVVANDPVHGWHFQPSVPWNELGDGCKLYRAIPDGYVIVPKVATIEMSIAFAEVWYSKQRAMDDDDMQDCWQAMLEASK